MAAASATLGHMHSGLLYEVNEGIGVVTLILPAGLCQTCRIGVRMLRLPCNETGVAGLEQGYGLIGAGL